MKANSIDRAGAVIHARRLEYFTLGWNSLEAVASICAGLLSGSIALVGFGLDSMIETGSAVALLWRFRRTAEMTEARRERAERVALRIVGWLFLLLSGYIAIDSALMLARHKFPDRTVPGIVVAGLSVIVMPMLARAKRRLAAMLSSKAMNADSRQSDFCAYLAGVTLVGLALNALFGWWWADPVAALVMCPIIAREGIRSLRGESCDCNVVADTPCCANGDCHQNSSMRTGGGDAGLKDVPARSGMGAADTRE